MRQFVKTVAGERITFMLSLIIKNGIIMAAIVGAAFASQQPFFNAERINTYNFPVLKKGDGYSTNFSVQGINDWLKTNVYDRVSGEVEKRQEVAVGEIEKQKEEVTGNAIDSTKKFLAEKVLDALGVKPETLCAP